MSLITVKDLKKTYMAGGDILTEALKGVSLQIEEKAFMAIAGPSGSGKSSLLHLIGGLDAASSGTVTFFDQYDLSKLNSHQLAHFRLHHIGFVFQAYNLINTLTARENVEYIMLLKGASAADRKAQAEEMLRRVGLKDHVNRFPSQLSGGQQQRVAVARAIAAAPKVVLADEPTANLDSTTSKELIALMRELNEEKNISFIFSTHDPLIMEEAKQLIKLKDGRIIS